MGFLIYLKVNNSTTRGSSIHRNYFSRTDIRDINSIIIAIVVASRAALLSCTGYLPKQ